MTPFSITSPAFSHEYPIPAEYTCQGRDVNPPLHIEGIPPDTHSLVLIVDDPDAPMGTWDHWILFNISPTDSIAKDSVPEGSVQGKNSWGKNQWGGPCPPSGVHRYFFTLYALDAMLDLSPNSTKTDVEEAMDGHTIGVATLMGTYKKS